MTKRAAVYLKAFRVIRDKCKKAGACANCEISNEFGACPILNMPEAVHPMDWKLYDD